MPFEELKARQSVVWGVGAYEPIVEIDSEIHQALAVLGMLVSDPAAVWFA